MRDDEPANAPNVFLAGKTMAQTQAANAGTRLQPVEWAMGVAAGVAAAHAVARGVGSARLVAECLASVESYCGVQQGVADLAALWW